jgi:hypothetical protein
MIGSKLLTLALSSLLSVALVGMGQAQDGPDDGPPPPPKTKRKAFGPGPDGKGDRGRRPGPDEGPPDGPDDGPPPPRAKRRGFGPGPDQKGDRRGRPGPEEGSPPPDGPRGGPRGGERPGPEGPQGPEQELRRAYDLLRQVKTLGKGTGASEDRLSDWTARAVKLYGEGVNSFEAGDHRKGAEYGIAAHDLARAVEHSRNADLGEDKELPPPPTRPGPKEDEAERVQHALREATDVIDDSPKDLGAESKVYIDAAKELVKAAETDAEAKRLNRAGELARAAVALAHVAEHVNAAMNDEPPPPPERPRGRGGNRPAPKGKRAPRGEGPPPRD